MSDHPLNEKAKLMLLWYKGQGVEPGDRCVVLDANGRAWEGILQPDGALRGDPEYTGAEDLKVTIMFEAEGNE